MSRWKTVLVSSLALLIVVPMAQAQLSTVVAVDFERAVVESAEGKVSSEKFNAALQAKQSDVEKKQKELEDQQRKLQNGARTLSEAAKAELQRDIDRRTTDLTRINEDAQKEMQALREDLLRPISERAAAILNGMAAEQGYTLVIDISIPDSNVVFVNPKNEITAELIKRIDASAPKEAAKPAAAAPSRPPTTPAPSGPKEP